ncbi:hypothetical protein J0H58_18825 [bacterium]|nr:hypothetical protein [bacterium]
MIGVRYTTTATGEVAKFVTCKKCGHGYGYWMRRVGTGSNTSWFLIGRDSAQGRSGREAEGELAERLRTEHDPVPCPECGHYQKKMIEPAREEKYGWVFVAGIVGGLLAGGGCFLLGSALAVLGGPDKWAHWLSRTVLGLMCPAAVCIPAAAYGLKGLLTHRYDPNAAPEDGRIDLGRERAMSPKEYARLAPKPRRSAGLDSPDDPPPSDDPPPIPFAPAD